jgi:hypothetical protein
MRIHQKREPPGGWGMRRERPSGCDGGGGSAPSMRHPGPGPPGAR